EREGASARWGGCAPDALLVLMIGDPMRVHAGPRQHFGYRSVEGFERTPAAVQKVVPAGMHSSSCRHTRHGVAVGVLERHRPVGEVGKVGCLDVVVAVGR